MILRLIWLGIPDDLFNGQRYSPRDWENIEEDFLDDSCQSARAYQSVLSPALDNVPVNLKSTYLQGLALPRP